ncbi:MAG: DNA topoisomerase IB [Nitratireductor sp.]|uniref:DNA topoisomerase IB n=1 Tax=Bauldia litoralis TaxID=665467 RepID=UPI003263AD98
MPASPTNEATNEPAVAADVESAGLIHVGDHMPGLRRLRCGRGFRYVTADGRTVRDRATLNRIRALVIPPAWTEVWIAVQANGHLQATGRDARNRKQYRYHPDFLKARGETKYTHMFVFARVLPAIRRQVRKDMQRKGLPWEKVVATVVYLLDKTLIRVGNLDYARQNGSFGLTTLRDRHVAIKGGTLRFEFKGKSGKIWRLKLGDRRAARIVKSCQDIPGQHLFQLIDADGNRRAIGSADVNAYLREIAGEEITAKDFRTWAGTVLAAITLREFEAVDTVAAARRNIRDAIECVASRLGNTPTICRKCYVHPEILSSYLNGALLIDVERRATATLGDAGLAPEEAAVLAFLRAGLRREKRRRRRGRGEATSPPLQRAA